MDDEIRKGLFVSILGTIGILTAIIGLVLRIKLIAGIGAICTGMFFLYGVTRAFTLGYVLINTSDRNHSEDRRCYRSNQPGTFWFAITLFVAFGLGVIAWGIFQLGGL